MYQTTSAPVYETQRLHLRPFVGVDASHIAATFSDAGMCRGVTDVPFSHQLTDAAMKSGHTDANHGSAEVLEKLGFETTGDIKVPNHSRNPDNAGKAFADSKAHWNHHA